MLGSIFFLDGDSFGELSSIEPPLRQRLERYSSNWTGQWDLIHAAGDVRLDLDIARRLAVLEQCMPGGDNVVIIARSSGARVGTLLAARRPIRAAIALGYPFHGPGRPDEPERYAHLAHITTPTLILQGVSDKYGGREILEKYPFSPAVTVEFIATDHKLRVSAGQWDAIAERILRFCGADGPRHHG